MYISLVFLKLAILIVQIKDVKMMQFRSEVLRLRLDLLFGTLVGLVQIDASSYPAKWRILDPFLSIMLKENLNFNYIVKTIFD